MLYKSSPWAFEMRKQLLHHRSQCQAKPGKKFTQASPSPWQTAVSRSSYESIGGLVVTSRNIDDAAVNEARAMRVAEIMNDFHLIQQRMAQYQATPSPQDYHAEGYEVLRQCRAEAQAVLAAPFHNEFMQPPRGPGEAEKRQLQR